MRGKASIPTETAARSWRGTKEGGTPQALQSWTCGTLRALRPRANQALGP